MKRLVLTSLIALALFATNSSVMTQQSEMLSEEFHQSYPLNADGRVSLGNINGAVRVTAWDRNEVKVDAVKKAYRRERLDEARIDVRSDPAGVHIETKYPDRSQTFTDGEGRQNNPAIVEYTLTVPRNARIDAIELINGALDIDGVTGDVKASTINGRLTARDLMGDTKLSTINGKLEATFTRLNQTKSISLGSVNGPLALTIPSDSNAEIRAGTVHGAITNEFGLPVRRGEYVGRDLAGQLGEGGPRIKLGSVNGAITIRHTSDGRPLSRATNLLAEKAKTKIKNKDEDYDEGDARSESRRTAREAARDAARAQVEASRSAVQAQRAEINARRAQRAAEIEAQRVLRDAQNASSEAAQAKSEVRVEAQRARVEAERAKVQALADARRAQVELSRAVRDRQRIIQREASRIRVEASQLSRGLARIELANRDAAATLRLVERESKNFTVTGTPQVNLQTFDGNITVRGWDKQEVQLTVSKRAASEQQMRGIQVRANQNGSIINIVAEFDKSFARQEGGISFTNALVNLDVYVPRSSMIRLSSGDGRLEIDGVNGNFDMNTGDGGIEVRDSRGRLVAKTGDGRIQVENFDGEASARTGDGRIILNGRFAKLGAQTGGGTIMLMVPDNYGAIIETNTESLENESGLSITEESGSSKRLRRWKLGSGGNLMTLRTADGRIILRRSGR